MDSALKEVLDRVALTAAWLDIEPKRLTDRNSMGDTPLHTVCTWGDVRAVKVLLKEGADVNASGESGSPPLINAIAGGSYEVVEVLVRHGADLGVVNEIGYTPLRYAMAVNADGRIKSILSKK